MSSALGSHRGSEEMDTLCVHNRCLECLVASSQRSDRQGTVVFNPGRAMRKPLGVSNFF